MNQPKTPKHILKLSTEEKRDFLNSFDNIFADMDGVIWCLYNPIKNAEIGFKLLENAGKNLIFLTNNSVRSMESNVKKFKELKLNVDEDNIYHPAKNIVKYLKNINFKGPIYVIGSDFLIKTLRLAGFEVIYSSHQFLDGFNSYGEKLFESKPVRAVVIDFDLNLTFLKLTRAQIYLNDPECLFISGASDDLVLIYKNTRAIGPGQFLKVLFNVTKRKPTILGKPGVDLGELLKKDFQITDSKRVLMIGDTLEQDIYFGKISGFQTLAVLSGSCNLEDFFGEINPDYLPDYYADSMADFIEFFKDIN